MTGIRCRACLLTCIDFRLHEPLARFLAQQQLEHAGADVVRVAGAARSLVQPRQPRDGDFVLEQLAVAHELHGIGQFHLINHEDCGAYGLESEPDSPEELAVHRADLRTARERVRQRFPGVEVQCHFMRLDGSTRVIL